MTTSAPFALLSAFVPHGDSSWNVGALRAAMIDAVLAVVGALVLLPVRGLSLSLVRQADRTPLRTMPNPTSLALATPARQHDVGAYRPESASTITRTLRTLISRAAADTLDRPQPAIHPVQFRHARPAESPGRARVTDTNEKRDFDQREPARDAGRHHRGRPAR